MSDTQTLGAGTGVVRSTRTPYSEPNIPSEAERRVAEIESRRRADREKKYHGMIFRHAAGELNDDEFSELVTLAADLGLPAKTIDDDLRAIRDVERNQHDIESAAAKDFAELEAAPPQARKDAKAAIMQTVTDRLADLGIENAREAMYEVFKIHAFAHRHDSPKQFTDHGVGSKVDAVATADAALKRAHELGQCASAALYRTKKANARLWPSAD